MPVPVSPAPRKQWTTTLFEDRGAGLRESIQVNAPTVPTAAGNTDIYAIVPEDGFLHSIEFSAIEGLVASDTNFVTFLGTNLGQDGTGAVSFLAAAPTNTTKVTGGTALVAGGRRSLVMLTGTPFASTPIRVLAGDRLRVRVTGTGTLPNTLSGGVFLFRFNP